MPEYGFPGLRPGDQWCVCAARWAEALEAGAACPVVLEATHMSALEFVDLDDLHVTPSLRSESAQMALDRAPCQDSSGFPSKRRHSVG